MHPIAILILAIVFVLVGILVLRLNAFVALILAALLVGVLTPAERLSSYADSQVESGKWTESQADEFVNKKTFAGRVTDGFGRTCGSIGLLIAMASIIGKCMLESGAADRIVRTITHWLGKARMGISFVASGFLLGIPVFFDTVFYLMIPLGQAAARKDPSKYLFYVLTIVAGATMAHSLVPPTPGPLVVVEQFGVDLLLMMVAGTIVGLVASTSGYLFASWISRRMTVSIPGEPSDKDNSSESAASRPSPGLIFSLMPIALPVLLIGLATGVGLVSKSFPEEDKSAWQLWVTEQALPIVKVLGDKNIALTIAAFVAVGLVVWSRKSNRKQVADFMHSAIMGAGMIILITAAGGAFGGTIRQSGIADEIARLAGDVQPLLLLPLAFGVTTLIRTAQGSATVAMVTAAGVLQAFASSDELQFNVVYLALAVGCGSKPIAWMADSGFWVICKMSGMTEIQGLQTVTPMSIIMGVVGLIVTIIGAWLIPLV